MHNTTCSETYPYISMFINVDLFHYLFIYCEFRIEIDARDKQDRTPMHLCCIEGHSNILQLLLLYKALDACIDTTGYINP